MALTDFFRINMPYGLRRNSADEWFVFNREYVPLGWNSKANQETIYNESSYSQHPVYTKYEGLTEKAIKKEFTDPDAIRRNEDGEIMSVFLYDDRTNPVNDGRHWDSYMRKIKFLSQFQKG